MTVLSFLGDSRSTDRWPINKNHVDKWGLEEKNLNYKNEFGSDAMIECKERL